MIFAVDFDGTLCKEAWPEIGEPNLALIHYLLCMKTHGEKIILWTCRDGELLEKAVSWCREYGLVFDAINDNLPEMIKRFGGNSRKIFADIYIDDRATSAFTQYC